MKFITVKIGPEPGARISGTPAEIMVILRAQAYRPELLPETARRSLTGYMDHLEKEIWRLYGVGIKSAGETTGQRAESMLNELARVGFLQIEEGSKKK